jgi:hypothetical protein
MPCFKQYLRIDPGDAGADSYHRKVQALLTALFGPYLMYPEREFRLHENKHSIQKQTGVHVMHSILVPVIERIRSMGRSVLESESYIDILQEPLLNLQDATGTGEHRPGRRLLEGRAGGGRRFILQQRGATSSHREAERCAAGHPGRVGAPPNSNPSGEGPLRGTALTPCDRSRARTRTGADTARGPLRPPPPHLAGRAIAAAPDHLTALPT